MYSSHGNAELKQMFYLQNPFGQAKPREAILATRTGKKEEDILRDELLKEKLKVSAHLIVIHPWLRQEQHRLVEYCPPSPNIDSVSYLLKNASFCSCCHDCERQEEQ